jgi:hypothetical protein
MFMLNKQMSLSERISARGILHEFSDGPAAEEARFFAELEHKYGAVLFIPGLDRVLLALHRLRGKRGLTLAEDMAIIEERARLLDALENAFTRAADNKSVSANTIVDSFRVFQKETDETDAVARVTVQRVAFTIQFRLTMDYSSLSAENKRFNDTVLAELAGEYAAFLQLLAVPPEAKEWSRQLRSWNNNISRDTINIYVARIIELSAEIADFIREKNIQEEKEIKLLEKRREELAGFKLPAALRRAIADRLGLNPEDLDPAVARKAAEITTG